MATKFIDKEYGTDASTAITDSAANRRKVQNLPDAAGLAYDKVDNQIKFNGADAIKILADTSTAQTLTNKTLTAPVITGSTQSAVVNSDDKVLAATVTYTTNVASTLTGYSWSVVAGATYVFEVNVPVTMTTNGGLTLSFKLTTATLTSIQYQSYASTAADNSTAVSTQGTTTTDATKVFDSKTAAYTLVIVKGSMVVNAAGTFAWQAAQNTTNSDTTSVLLGGYAKMERVL